MATILPTMHHPVQKEIGPKDLIPHNPAEDDNRK